MLISTPRKFGKFTTGSSKVVVGVVDSGSRYPSRSFIGNIWINQGEDPPANQIRCLIAVDGDGLFTFYDLNDPENAAYVSQP